MNATSIEHYIRTNRGYLGSLQYYQRNIFLLETVIFVKIFLLISLDIYICNVNLIYKGTYLYMIP